MYTRVSHDNPRNIIRGRVVALDKSSGTHAQTSGRGEKTAVPPRGEKTEECGQTDLHERANKKPARIHEQRRDKPPVYRAVRAAHERARLVSSVTRRLVYV